MFLFTIKDILRLIRYSYDIFLEETDDVLVHLADTKSERERERKKECSIFVFSLLIIFKQTRPKYI